MAYIKYNLFFLIIILNYLFNIICKASNEDITKAMSCMGILSQKLKGQTPDPRNYSSMLLKCFITITDEEAKEVLVGFEQGMDSIEEEEIEKLTDFSTLSQIPKDELNDYSDKLQNAIQEFRKMHENYNSAKKDKGKSYDRDTDDEDYKRAHPSRGNSLGSFMKKMTGILKAINNMGSIIIVIIFLYFGSIMFKKYCDNGKKKNKIKETNKNKNNDKDKKIKKKTE